jgi:hypothetical protein
MRKRAIPYVGRPVAVVYLGAVLGGVIERVEEAGRRLSVRTEEGEELAFVLDPATAGFTLGGGQTQARLRFLEDG